MRRVAVTGLGVASPLGATVDDLLANLIAGHSGICRLDTPPLNTLRSPVAGVVRFDPSVGIAAPKLRMLDRVSQLALYAAATAMAAAGLDPNGEPSGRCGVSWGSGLGGATTTDQGYHILYGERSDRIKPYTVLASMTNAAAAWIGIDYGLSGPNLTYSTACSSSAVAIGEAARRIAYGDVDMMLAGGAEAPLSFGVLRAWEAMRTIATPDPDNAATSCKPFSLNRSGLVLAEGAAAVVLEEWEHAIARGAHIHAELLGYGLTSDAAHITRPTVAGQAAAMRAALRDARLDADDIDYVNAHGTATLQNDAVETAAIKEVFGAAAYRLPVSSTKSMHGHLLGAAGALEFLITVACLERGVVPATLHLDVRDPACDLDYVTEGTRTGIALNAAMSNSFAFGGTNAVLIARAAR